MIILRYRWTELALLITCFSICGSLPSKITKIQITANASTRMISALSVGRPSSRSLPSKIENIEITANASIQTISPLSVDKPSSWSLRSKIENILVIANASAQMISPLGVSRNHSEVATDVPKRAKVNDVSLLTSSTGESRSALAAKVSPFLICLLIVFIVILVHRKINRIVKEEVETRDIDLIGVDIHIGSVFLNPFNGRLYLYKIAVDNPKGYLNQNILVVDELMIDINLQRLLLSCITDIEVQKLYATGVNVTVEQSMLKSNVGDVINFVKRGRTKEKEIPKKKRKYELHEVEIRGIKATATLSSGTSCFGKSVRGELEIAPVLFDDFHKTATDIQHDIQRVIASLLENVLKNVHSSRKGLFSCCGSDQSLPSAPETAPETLPSAPA